MPVSLPVMFQRDLERLLALSDAQLGTACNRGVPIYGFIILGMQRGTDGTLLTLTVTRSGVTLDIGQGRIVPAQRKVG